MSSEEYFDWADDVEEMMEQQEHAAAQAALSSLGEDGFPSASGDSSESEELSAMSTPATMISMDFLEPELCDDHVEVGILENALDLAFPKDQCTYEKPLESDGPFGWLDPDSWDADTLREYFLATDGLDEVEECEMVESAIPATNSQQEADTGVAAFVYPYHHLNFYNCPVEHRSNTPAAISMWVAVHAKKLGQAVEEIELYRGVNRKHVIASQAGKHVDAVAYDGPQDVLDNFSGSALVERLGGHCRKVYQPYGNWVLEEPSPDEERPSCTDDEPCFLHGWNNSGPPFPCHSSEVANTTNINDDGRLHESTVNHEKQNVNHEKPLVRMSPLWQYESADGEVNWPAPPRCEFSKHKHHANKPEHPDVVVEIRVSSFKVLKSLKSSLRVAAEAEAAIPANVADQARAAIFGNSAIQSSTSSNTAEQPALQQAESQAEATGPEQSESSHSEKQESSQSVSEQRQSSDPGAELVEGTQSPEHEESAEEAVDEARQETEREGQQEEETERPEQYERPQSRIGHRDDGYNTPERSKGRFAVYDADTSSPEPSPTPGCRSSVNGGYRSVSNETLASIGEESEEESEELEGDDEEDFHDHIEVEPHGEVADEEMIEDEVNEESSEDIEEDPEEVIGEVYEESVDQDSNGADSIHEDPSHIELGQEEQTSADISSLEIPVQDVSCNSQTSNEDSETDDAYFYSSSNTEATTPELLSSSVDDASWVDEAVDDAEEQKRILADRIELTEHIIEVPSIDQILATLRQSYLSTIIITPPDDKIYEVEQLSPITAGIESDYLPTITVTPPEDSIDELEQLSPTTTEIEFEALAIEPVTAFDDLLTEALKQIMGNDVLKKVEPEISTRTNTDPRPLHDGFIRATSGKTISTTVSTPLRAESSGENQANHIEYENLENIPLRPSFNDFLFGTSTIAIGHKAMELGKSVYQKFWKW